jgi:hypothetical protein
MTTINQFNMKKIIFLLTITAAFMLSSCEKDSLGVSKVTTYAKISLNGASTIFSQMGTPFNDPGCVALEGTTDISSRIVVDPVLDGTVGGMYTVTYKVANSDGFWASTTRKVYIGDFTAPLSGNYKSAGLKRKTLSSGAQSSFAGPYTVMVFSIGGGKYFIGDMIGGWYQYGRSYGAAYAGPGHVKVNADNTVSMVYGYPWVWGPCSITATGATVDPTTKTWVLHTTGAGVLGYEWTITLNNPVSF